MGSIAFWKAAEAVAVVGRKLAFEVVTSLAAISLATVLLPSLKQREPAPVPSVAAPPAIVILRSSTQRAARSSTASAASLPPAPRNGSR